MLASSGLYMANVTVIPHIDSTWNPYENLSILYGWHMALLSGVITNFLRFLSDKLKRKINYSRGVYIGLHREFKLSFASPYILGSERVYRTPIVFWCIWVQNSTFCNFPMQHKTHKSLFTKNGNSKHSFTCLGLTEL